jgi:hypothetical protein
MASVAEVMSGVGQCTTHASHLETAYAALGHQLAIIEIDIFQTVQHAQMFERCVCDERTIVEFERVQCTAFGESDSQLSDAVVVDELAV